ncbi:regulator of hemoglobinization and erythroid cell expansion protein isoform X2 [Pelodiscus sinensis]|uniref:regulator of hemoglobinization and erythroid cell expansion protein isoform X2 n=1 Tax=Pelodiscus sinensis TaxID=13735 RepID=UPI003F6A54FD
MPFQSIYWWIPILISAVSSAFHVLLLVVFYIKLSRKIDNHACSKQASSTPFPKPEQPNTSPAGKEALRRPAVQGDSDSSSDSAESSDSSPSSRQCPRSEQEIDYTSLVFQAAGHSASNTGDYENMKTGADYVNVDPKKRTVDFWPCLSPVASAPIEYTEVKL